MTSQPLKQARQVLETFSKEKAIFLEQLRDQAVKIADLEQEVQKQAAAATQAQNALTNAQIENEALRALIPDRETLRAFEDLTQFLAAPARTYAELRIAA